MTIVLHPVTDSNYKIAGRPAQEAQLNIPTGPTALLRGGRRERTDADKHWYTKQLAVQHVKLIDKALFDRMAFYASLNPERMAYPSVARLGRDALCSARTVQRALRRLESAGLVECLTRVGGRATGRYLVLGRHDVTRGVTLCHPWGDRESPEVLREGKSTSTKISYGNDSVQTIDPSETRRDSPEKAFQNQYFPSQEQKQEKAPVPKAPERPKKPKFAFPKIVARWFKLMRKLSYECTDDMAMAFDKLPSHQEKKVVIDGLEAEERDLAHQGKLSFGPVPKPKRLGELPATSGTAAYMDRYRMACEHVPAADLASSCARCGVYIGGA